MGSINQPAGCAPHHGRCYLEHGVLIVQGAHPHHPRYHPRRTSTDRPEHSLHFLSDHSLQQLVHSNYHCAQIDPSVPRILLHGQLWLVRCGKHTFRRLRVSGLSAIGYLYFEGAPLLSRWY